MILTFGGSGGRDPIRDYISGGFQVHLGGFQVAMGAVDVLRRQLAVELGPYGIRVVTLHSGGVPETTREDWREAITRSFVDTRACSSGWRRSMMSATWPLSLPRTWPAP